MGRAGDAEILHGERRGSADAPGPEQLIEQLAVVEGFYSSLMRQAKRREGAVECAEPGLGGQLLYAGVLDQAGSALATAGNVAGAATLAATANPDAQRQAVREGVVDFLVNSLDEALRILKNEIRKREPVAVCVGREPEEVERAMLERGVRPDLLAEAGKLLRGVDLRDRETRMVRTEPVEPTQARLAWSVAEMRAQWMPKLDALAENCLDVEDYAARRWLRHAPRYVSRLARGVRVLRCSPSAAQAMIARTRNAVESGSIGAPVWMVSSSGQARVEHTFHPQAIPERAR
jgi:hypothetical protein